MCEQQFFIPGEISHNTVTFPTNELTHESNIFIVSY